MTATEVAKLQNQFDEVCDGKLINTPGWGIVGRLLESLQYYMNKEENKNIVNENKFNEMEILDG